MKLPFEIMNAWSLKVIYTSEEVKLECSYLPPVVVDTTSTVVVSPSLVVVF